MLLRVLLSVLEGLAVLAIPVLALGFLAAGLYLGLDLETPRDG